LFSTENGEVFECACFGRLVLTFKGYWMAFDRGSFLRFRHEVVGFLHCPRGRQSIQKEGLRFNDKEGNAALTLAIAEADELVWLLDASPALLAAQEGHQTFNRRESQPRGVNGNEDTCKNG
jgi:hypothetical protein